IDVAKGLEGLRRSDGIHAAAVVITKEPLTTYLPIQRKPEPGKPIEEAPVVTQYEMHGVEDLGLLKMDFLGLRNLDIISDTLELIEMTRGEQVDIDDVTLDDEPTYDLLRAGQTVGVFQLESPPMRALMRSLAPDSFEDVAALVALYRPGPMAANMHNDYADRKNGRKEISYIHDDADEVLGATYGLCLTGDTVVLDAQTGRPHRLDEIDPAAGFVVQGVDEDLVEALEPITHWVCNGEREVVRLRLSNGMELRGTPEHRVLTDRGWKPMGDLVPSDHVAVPSKLAEPSGKGPLSRDELRIIGYLIADGSLSMKAAITFCNSDRRLLEEFDARVQRAFPSARISRRTGVRGVCHHTVGNGKGNGGGASPLLLLLRALGLKHEIGSVTGGPTSRFKSVPPEVFQSSDDDVGFFLASLWDCDGHVGERMAHYRTISPALADDVQRLLQRVGIRSTMTSAPVGGRGGRTETAFQVSVFDGGRFAAFIAPHLVSRKRDVAFAAEPMGTNFDRRTFLDELAVATPGMSNRSRAAQLGLPRSHMQPYMVEAHPRIGERSVAGVLDMVELPAIERLRRVQWISVATVEPAGRELVYDVTVDRIHNFVANGMVVHNCIYQEQMMRLAQKFAGYTLAESDSLRKAAGKKSRDIMAKERVKFVAGCEELGYGTEVGQAWFDMIEPFADYAFNKSHSYGYGLIAYQIAYLKANYPAEYMSSLLTSVKSNLDKAAIYLAECRAMDIPVTVADINRALVDFAPELARDEAGAIVGGEIVFGMSAVRGVGSGLCHLIIAEREANGPYADFYDFCERVDLGVLNKKTVEALIKAGAFDSVGHRRQGLLMVFESIIDRTIARRKEAEAGVMSLFDTAGDDGGGGVGAGFDEREEIPDLEFPKVQKLAFEKEMLGLYVSDHPLFGAEDFLARRTELGLDALAECEDGAIKTVGGVITNLQRKWTKKGDLMGVFVLEDLRSNVETMVFPRTMTEHGHKLEDDAIVL
ncbi:MAG TPA: LAGLIDADG family homing endonuclease, partial [Acidimicrobiia bacterium]|nr:LAGLIDADG family homing endonuclease [Acidimicrobiia bacterium]